MTRLTALLALLALLAAPAVARLRAAPPLPWLVQASDLIVVGTLESLDPDAAAPNGIAGSLRVTEALWGNARRGERLPVQIRLFCPCAGCSPEHARGEPRLWLLQALGDGTFYTEYPDRAQPPELRSAVQAALRDQPFRLTLPGRPLSLTNELPDAEPVPLRLAFRNATDRPALAPALEYRDGALYLPAGARLTLTRWNGSEEIVVQPRPGALRELPVGRTVTVPPGGEHAVTAELGALFALDAAWSHHLRLSLPGAGDANWLNFYFTTPPGTAEGERAEAAAPAVAPPPAVPRAAPLPPARQRPTAVDQALLALLLFLLAVVARRWLCRRALAETL